MSAQSIVQILRAMNFFEEVPDADLKLLAEMSRFVEFPAKSVIFRELQTARDVYVIVSGRVSLVIFEPGLGGRELMQVGEGDLIGWSALVGRTRLSDTAHALEPVKAIAIDGERVLALCTEDPQFGVKFMQLLAQVISQRLNATRSLLVKKCGSQLPEFSLESD